MTQPFFRGKEPHTLWHETAATAWNTQVAEAKISSMKNIFRDAN
ncbi:hypothetical protein GMO_25140 [Gluconobacter morbifer G707]|uniref:Uncharacterized protein n=1 Tax=Gluconobacter morbifer G707 TaxID=1088869 RepID=G6XL91_9PROT|nr:hypothetical protein GMO_25140 [Gluconobacter morbifer G707]